MYDQVAMATFYLDFGSLLLAAYILKTLYPLIARASSFSRILNAMFFTTIVFCILLVLEIFSLAPQELLEILSPLLAFILVLLLVFAVKEIEKGVLAHDHLVRRRFK